jgi:hypothetical protein
MQEYQNGPQKSQQAISLAQMDAELRCAPTRFFSFDEILELLFKMSLARSNNPSETHSHLFSPSE